MAFITLEEYKTYATISSPNQDNQITALLEPVSQTIEAYLGYTFTDDSTAVSNPRKRAVFMIQKFQQEYLLDETDTYISYVQWDVANPYIGYGSSIRQDVSESRILGDNEWFADVRIGKITFLRPISQDYIATIEYKTTKTISEDIKLAALMLLDYWINKKNFNASIVNQGQSTTKVAMKNLPAHIEAIIYPHKKV